VKTEKPIFEPMFGPNAAWQPESGAPAQPELFFAEQPAEPQPTPDVLWASQFLSEAEQEALFAWCRDDVAWKYMELYPAGRAVPIPRGLAWFGDVPYSYSGLTHKACPMPPQLRALADRIEACLAAQGTPARFNSVLMNYYRDGNDSIGMHSDDESQLGAQPVIASVSLGAPRKFRFQHKLTRTRHETPLPGGSLLVMKGRCQDDWRHGVPKEPGAGARVNLTFRFTHR
jgi:alkylated DNA repair dioxygenase AlkB